MYVYKHTTKKFLLVSHRPSMASTSHIPKGRHVKTFWLGEHTKRNEHKNKKLEIIEIEITTESETFEICLTKRQRCNFLSHIYASVKKYEANPQSSFEDLIMDRVNIYQ